MALEYWLSGSSIDGIMAGKTGCGIAGIGGSALIAKEHVRGDHHGCNSLCLSFHCKDIYVDDGAFISQVWMLAEIATLTISASLKARESAEIIERCRNPSHVYYQVDEREHSKYAECQKAFARS